MLEYILGFNNNQNNEPLYLLTKEIQGYNREIKAISRDICELEVSILQQELTKRETDYDSVKATCNNDIFLLKHFLTSALQQRDNLLTLVQEKAALSKKLCEEAWAANEAVV